MRGDRADEKDAKPADGTAFRIESKVRVFSLFKRIEGSSPVFYGEAEQVGPVEVNFSEPYFCPTF